MGKKAGYVFNFRQQVAFSKTISQKKAESVLELLQDLEKQEILNDLLKLMVAWE